MLIKILVICCLIGFVNAKNQILIGILFNGESDENQIAFFSAVDRINMHEREFELIPVAKYITVEDNFKLEKYVCDLIKQGVVAIFGPSSANVDIIDAICEVANIPHIVYDWKSESSENQRHRCSMCLNLYPDSLLLSRAYADAIKNFDWSSYTIIYETESDLITLQDILQIHKTTDSPITVRQLYGIENDFRPFLKKIKSSGESCFVLLCNINLVVPLLRQANDLKMLGEYQSYFIPSMDSTLIDFDELINTMANITSIRLVDPSDFELRTALHDWEQREKRQGRTYHINRENIRASMILINDVVSTFAAIITDMNSFAEIRNTSIDCTKLRPWQFGRQIVQHIKTKTANALSGRIEFNEYGYRTYFSIQIVELSNTGFQPIAEWNSVEGLIDESSKNDRQEKKLESKIHNKTFIVTSRLGAPFLMYKQFTDNEAPKGNNRFEGYSLELIDNIAKMLGFNYIFDLAPDGKYGSYNKVTKKWDGLVKQLLDGKADLAICDLTITSARRTAVDFSAPFMTLGISILYAKSTNEPPDLFSFLSPFSLEVWIYMATAYLGVSLLLFALARIAPDDWESSHACNQEPEEVENLWTIMNSTWLTMGSIMGQGCDILPKAISTRLVTGMWWFFALMMLNSYTANLAAFLTMSRMDATIESAEDLAKQTKIKYGAVSGGSTMAFFKESNFSTYQKMWTAMESASPSVFTKSNDEGVERVLKSKRLYAYLMESTSLEYIIERNCDLTQVGGLLDYKSYGIAMPFNSPYRKLISAAVLKMGETGVLYGLKIKWWKEMHGGGKCTSSSTDGADTAELGIDNVGGVFLVLGVGLFASFIIGIFEFLWHVKEVAVEEKMTPAKALKAEAFFAAKIWMTTKPVRTSNASISSQSKSSMKSKSRRGSETGINAIRQSIENSIKSVKSSGKKLNLP